MADLLKIQVIYFAKIRELTGLTRETFIIKKGSTPSNVLRLIEEKHSIDLMILDVSLPIIDGVEVCRMIKERGDTCDSIHPSLCCSFSLVDSTESCQSSNTNNRFYFIPT